MARKMKDSGVEWIGSIPEDWEVMPLKYKVKLNQATLSEGTLPDYEFDYIEIGSVNIMDGIKALEHVKFEDSPLRARRIVKKDDIIISTVRTYLKAIAKVPERSDLIASTGFAVLTPYKINANYLAYMVKTDYFTETVTSHSVGVSYPAINANELIQFKILIPKIQEQNKIVKFLDEKIGEIDNIISKTKESIEEYKKYRKSVVIKAVTKGLQTGIPMKKTDSAWIGEIPAHWDYLRIQRLFEIVDERNENPDADLLSLYTAIGVKPRSELEEKGNKAVTVMNYKIVKKNDIIVNKLLAWMGAIGYSDYEGVTSPDYDVYRAKKEANVVRNYYNEYFRNTCFNGDCYKYGHGIMLMRWRTYPEEFLRIKVPNPPLEEQQEIAKYLDEKCGEIDALIAKKQAFIEEMENYKKSIIYEYVTGKKEVV